MLKRPVGKKLVAEADSTSLLMGLTIVGGLSMGLVSCSGANIDEADDAPTPAIAQSAADSESNPSESNILITDPVEYYEEYPDRTRPSFGPLNLSVSIQE